MKRESQSPGAGLSGKTRLAVHGPDGGRGLLASPAATRSTAVPGAARPAPEAEDRHKQSGVFC